MTIFGDTRLFRRLCSTLRISMSSWSIVEYFRAFGVPARVPGPVDAETPGPIGFTF